MSSTWGDRRIAGAGSRYCWRSLAIVTALGLVFYSWANASRSAMQAPRAWRYIRATPVAFRTYIVLLPVDWRHRVVGDTLGLESADGRSVLAIRVAARRSMTPSSFADSPLRRKVIPAAAKVEHPFHRTVFGDREAIFRIEPKLDAHGFETAHAWYSIFFPKSVLIISGRFRGKWDKDAEVQSLETGYVAMHIQEGKGP